MKILESCSVHSSWEAPLKKALESIDPKYLEQLSDSTDWLPGRNKIFSAFSLPKNDVKYILFGESPYPRATSANGYAFWDANVKEIFSSTGLSKEVNRATSLRNFIKLLLICEGRIQENNLSQSAIAAMDKIHLISTLDSLFENLIQQGFLLLNASLVLSDMNKTKEARYWQPFIQSILRSLHQEKPKLILFGKIAEMILSMPDAAYFDYINAVHPYNLSFIHDKKIQAFFKPMHLLGS